MRSFLAAATLAFGRPDLGQTLVFSRVNGRDIAIPPGCLLVAKSKNNESRIIPLNHEAREALQALVGEALEGEMIFTFARNGVSSSTIKGGFELACDRAGITYGLTRVGGLTWHGLRHTFATRLRAAGVHAFDIKELMGHKILSVTVGYAHASPEAMRRAVERCENHQHGW